MGVTVRQKRVGKGNPWYVFVHQNKKIVCRKAGGGSKREAEAMAAELRKRLTAGDITLGNGYRPESPEIVGYAKRFIDEYAKVACKQNTWHSYEAIVRHHIAPHWTGKKLHEITRADVKQLLLMKQQHGLAPGTVQNIKAFISGLFTHAYEDGILETNPALKMGKFIKKTIRRDHVQPLTKEQVKKVLAATQSQYPEHYAFMLCAFRTGMRLGELLGLSWDNVDFSANMIEIRTTYSHAHFDTPKSHKPRRVDMSDQLGRALQRHRSWLLTAFSGRLPEVEARMPIGTTKRLQLVFPSRKGGPQDGDNFRKRLFSRIIEAADVPRFRIHDIRHTFASLLLQQGEPLHYVKEQLGHASIQTTVDVYGHLVPGSNRNAVNRLDDPEESRLKLATG